MIPPCTSDPPGEDERDGRCAQVVLGTYNAALSVSGRATAFDAAVRAYLEYNPEISAEEAGRAAARIIGHTV